MPAVDRRGRPSDTGPAMEVVGSLHDKDVHEGGSIDETANRRDARGRATAADRADGDADGDAGRRTGAGGTGIDPGDELRQQPDEPQHVRLRPGEARD